MAQSLTIPESWSRIALGGSGLAFICYAAASIRLLPGGQVEGSILLLALVLAFWAGYFLRDLFWIWIIFGLFLVANVCASLIPMSWSGIQMPWGIYGNPNLLGCALALGLASALAYRLWIFIPPVLGGLWLTQSRGAILGASAALFIWLWPKYKTTAFTAAAFGLIAIIASQHGEAEGVWQRMGIYQDTLNHLTVFGSGWGSFFDEYWAWPIHRNIGFARASHAYNDYLEIILELGVGAIFLFIFALEVMRNARGEAKLIIYAYGVMALTFFPLYVWPIGPLVAATLGNLSREPEWQR